VTSLDVIASEVKSCTRCALHAGRQNTVPGTGDPTASLMFIGEAPGAHEDALGEPFVGPAGRLLDRMLAAMERSRREVYITNVVKCRPPSNRNPEPAEREACRPFLLRQVEAVRPRVIVTLGGVALRHLFPEASGIMSARGQWRQLGMFHGSETWTIDVMPTYHPAFLLREPAAKAVVWRDLQAVMAKLRGAP
jgi:uracil-DNA glycosylase